MPGSDTGERVTPVLDFPSRDGLAVHAVRADYGPGRILARSQAPGRRVRVRDRRQRDVRARRPRTGLAEGGRLVLRAARRAALGVTQCEPDLPASFIAFFVLGEGEDPRSTTVTYGRLRSVMTWLAWEPA